MEHSITFAPEVIGRFGSFPITNTLLMTWWISLFLIIVGFLATRKLALVPRSTLQNVVEVVVEGVSNLTTDLAHSRAKSFLPILLTFFLFIIVSNWFGLL